MRQIDIEGEGDRCWENRFSVMIYEDGNASFSMGFGRGLILHGPCWLSYEVEVITQEQNDYS